MFRLSLREFLADGRLGEVAIGSTRQDVLGYLGEPDHWAIAGEWERSPIWVYGSLELHFFDPVQPILSMIFSDHLDWTRRSREVHVDPWVLDDQLGFDQACRLLEDEGLAPRELPVQGYPDSCELVLASGVVLRFERPEGSTQRTLHAFWCC